MSGLTKTQQIWIVVAALAAFALAVLADVYMFKRVADNPATTGVLTSVGTVPAAGLAAYLAIERQTRKAEDRRKQALLAQRLRVIDELALDLLKELHPVALQPRDARVTRMTQNEYNVLFAVRTLHDLEGFYAAVVDVVNMTDDFALNDLGRHLRGQLVALKALTEWDDLNVQEYWAVTRLPEMLYGQVVVVMQHLESEHDYTLDATSARVAEYPRSDLSALVADAAA